MTRPRARATWRQRQVSRRSRDKILFRHWLLGHEIRLDTRVDVRCIQHTDRSSSFREINCDGSKSRQLHTIFIPSSFRGLIRDNGMSRAYLPQIIVNNEIEKELGNVIHSALASKICGGDRWV